MEKNVSMFPEFLFVFQDFSPNAGGERKCKTGEMYKTTPLCILFILSVPMAAEKPNNSIILISLIILSYKMSRGEPLLYML